MADIFRTASQHQRQQQHRREDVQPNAVHGFVGHFTCHLFGGIKLDTRHGSAGRNTFHWESMFFPLHEPVSLTQEEDLPRHRSVGVRLERCSATKKCDAMPMTSEQHHSDSPVTSNQQLRGTLMTCCSRGYSHAECAKQNRATRPTNTSSGTSGVSCSTATSFQAILYAAKCTIRYRTPLSFSLCLPLRVTDAPQGGSCQALCL
jgi:hypothetical protein